MLTGYTDSSIAPNNSEVAMLLKKIPYMPVEVSIGLDHAIWKIYGTEKWEHQR